MIKRIVLFADVHGNITGLREVIKAAKKLENVIVYGHYHEPHVIPMGDKVLINCASVGQRRRDNLSNYTIIEYDEEKIAVIQRQVPYDKAEEDRLVEERGMMRRL